MRFLQTRSLRHEEESDLRRRRHDTLVRGILCAVAVPLLVVTASQAPVLLADGFWPRVFFGLSLFGVPLLGLTAWRSLTLSLNLRRDERQGDVEVYSENDSDGVTHHQERLPHSGVVWTINDKPTAITSTADSVPVANAPDTAQVAAQWLAPAMESSEKKYFANRRQITASESLELRRHQLHLAWVRWRGLYAFDLFVALILTLSASGTSLGRYDWYGVIALLVALLAFHLQAAKDLWTALSLSSDIAQGRILIVKVERDAATSPIYEVLPKSGMPWSVDGSPAPWRLGLPFTAWQN
jgi:hypothetical protein